MTNGGSDAERVPTADSPPLPFPPMPTIVSTLAGGGGGKSTVAVNLAHELMARGYSITVLDCDAQSTATLLLGHSPSTSPLTEAPVSVDPSLGLTRRDVLPFGTLRLYRSGRSVSLASRSEFEAHIARGRKDSQLCLIDTAPGLGAGTLAALAAADLVLAIARPAPVSISCLVDTYNAAKHIAPGAQLRVVLNLVKSRRANARQIAAKIDEILPGTRFDTVIPDDADCEAAAAKAMAVRRYAPTSRSAQAFCTLTEDILLELGLPLRASPAAATFTEVANAAR
jgi:chromosome partitioning protein